MERDPLEQLDSSHRRQDEAMHELLEACEQDDRERIADVLAFLERSTPRHFADEEDSLFPRLATHAPALTTQLHRIAAEHRDHEARIQRLRERFEVGDLAAVHAEARELDQVWRAHASEEDELFAQVRSVVPAAELAAIAAEMQGRRGRGGGGRP